MSWRNKVIWSEGLFLRPQHFQQHERYFEGYVEGRAAALQTHSWGFKTLKLDADQLAIGKVSIASARGVFPDGTPFNIPDDTPPPPPLDVVESDRDKRVYLALPVRQEGRVEVQNDQAAEGLGRYLAHEQETWDTASDRKDPAPMRVGALRTRLLLDDDERAEYACLAISHIVECKVDKQVVIDDKFIPPMLDCQVSPVLSGFLSELSGLLHHRGEDLGGRVAASGRGGAADIADYLLLQAINQYQPVVTHFAQLSGLHPEAVYRLLISVAGHLSTFTADSKRTPEFPPYDHDNLKATFTPVELALRNCLGVVIVPNAIPIPLKDPKYGIRAALITDRGLLADARFVLAVRADLATDKILQRFPTSSHIGSVEKIRELVMSQLPGIAVRALPVAPRQIPYDAGSVYFELDAKSDYWPDMKTSGGFAIHVGGDFPGLEMDFWAIRR